MHRVRIHICRNHVWLGLVLIEPLRRPHVVDRVDHVEEFHRFVSESHLRKRDDRPQRGVRVLSTVFAKTRRIAFDIPRVMWSPVERRRQEQHHLRVASHEMGTHGFYRSRGPSWIRLLRENGP